MKTDLEEAWKLLPEKIRQDLLRAVKTSRTDTEEQFISEMMVGECPKCGGERTRDCEEIPEMLDNTVGLCLDCGYLWCLECEGPLMEGIDCKHWGICEGCFEQRDELGMCRIPAWECNRIIEVT